MPESLMPEYLPPSPLDAVRFLIADVGEDSLLADSQVAEMLALNGGSIRRAAADCLDAIATSEVLVSKKIRTQDLATDGPAVAAELRAQARNQRALAQAEKDAEESDWDGFDVIDTVQTGRRRPELAPGHEVWGL